MADSPLLINGSLLNDHSNLPLISIIVTSYNYGRYLSDALKSVIAQTYPNIEIIVVDDGSTDNTREVAALFPAKYTYQKHQGVSTAKNNGIHMSQGEFIICLDGDDKLLPTYAEKTYCQIIKSSKTAFVYTGSQIFNETNGIENIWMPRRLFSKYSLFANWFGALGPVMMRKKAFESLDHGFDPFFITNEDLELCFRLLSNGWKCDLVYEPIHWYRIHEGSLNPITLEKRRVAEANLDKKFWFRKTYRSLYGLYKKTIGRGESLMRSPPKYLKGVQKKIQVADEAKKYLGADAATAQKARKIQKEINFTIDMMVEWHNNEPLQKYYEAKIAAFEDMLTHLAPASKSPD